MVSVRAAHSVAVFRDRGGTPTSGAGALEIRELSSNMDILLGGIIYLIFRSLELGTRGARECER